MDYLQFDLKGLTLDEKREPDQDGSFEGYASVFDVVDQGLDVVSRGAFRKSIGSGRPVKMLWQHDQSQPIGVFEEIREDEKGLFVKGRILREVQKGREAMALMRAGAIDSMSIGYKTKQASQEGGGSVRRLDELDLFEISLVTFPMLPDAVVTAIKSVDWTNKRDIEQALRDVLGLSQSEAKAFIAEGFAGLHAKRDVDNVADDEPGDLQEWQDVLTLIGQLQENISNV